MPSAFSAKASSDENGSGRAHATPSGQGPSSELMTSSRFRQQAFAEPHGVEEKEAFIVCINTGPMTTQTASIERDFRRRTSFALGKIH